MTTRGRLVAIEGIDGAGKSTLQAQLAKALRKQRVRVRLWREPSDPGLGRRAQRAGPTRPWTAALFFTLDRARSRSRLDRLLSDCDVVLSDRSFYSTLAYQGSAVGPAERRRMGDVQRAVARRPDVVLWLRLPPEAALLRIRRRGARPAPLERQRTLRRVAAAYARLARSNRWVTLDATRPVAELAVQAFAQLYQHRREPAPRQRR
ncbi:MAG TPA: dTMP kinase [Thermoplasmata archaeon]|nr:dTMP kinase [Thermoplasmata archaeon]